MPQRCQQLQDALITCQLNDRDALYASPNLALCLRSLAGASEQLIIFAVDLQEAMQKSAEFTPPPPPTPLAPLQSAATHAHAQTHTTDEDGAEDETPQSAGDSRPDSPSGGAISRLLTAQQQQSETAHNTADDDTEEAAAPPPSLVKGKGKGKAKAKAKATSVPVPHSRAAAAEPAATAATAAAEETGCEVQCWFKTHVQGGKFILQKQTDMGYLKNNYAHYKKRCHFCKMGMKFATKYVDLYFMLVRPSTTDADSKAEDDIILLPDEGDNIVCVKCHELGNLGTGAPERKRNRRSSAK